MANQEFFCNILFHSNCFLFLGECERKAFETYYVIPLQQGIVLSSLCN